MHRQDFEPNAARLDVGFRCAEDVDVAVAPNAAFVPAAVVATPVLPDEDGAPALPPLPATSTSP